MSEFEALRAEAMDAVVRDDFDRAVAVYERAMTAATNESDRALAEIGRAGACIARHDPDPPLTMLREQFLRRHSPLHACYAAYHLMMHCVDRNKPEEAQRYLPALLRDVHELGDPTMVVRAYDVAAGVESTRGNFIAAREYGMVALAEVDRCPDGELVRELRVTIAHNLAYNCLAGSLYADAARYGDEALARAEARGHYIDKCALVAAFAHLCRDHLDDAERLTERAASIREDKYVHYLRGELARRRGDRDRAAAHFQKLEPFYPEVPRLVDLLLSRNLAPFMLPE